MPLTDPSPLQDARALHADAVRDLVHHAGRIAAGSWTEPLGPGRWSPAQVVVHLTLVYDALLEELGGGAPMRLRTRGWQRLLLRFTIRPRLLAGRFFPRGVRAPREVRPPDVMPEQGEAVERFRTGAAAMEAALHDAVRGGARVRLTHPYLGAMDAADTLRFCAAHIRHHQAQLPPAPPR